ncbi:hypothetical protein EVAR_29273_1 [Eumeta japonica]|uniref:Uncharacterized protein n=1 Tax=Eumeta variegata TaxID=151549 RepID=A0A4C1VV89_EUMVA|nr:hypothetical protein EVAR_29273_1 [Eumeta japonica]
MTVFDTLAEYRREAIAPAVAWATDHPSAYFTYSIIIQPADNAPRYKSKVSLGAIACQRAVTLGYLSFLKSLRQLITVRNYFTAASATGPRYSTEQAVALLLSYYGVRPDAHAPVTERGRRDGARRPAHHIGTPLFLCQRYIRKLGGVVDVRRDIGTPMPNNHLRNELGPDNDNIIEERCRGNGHYRALRTRPLPPQLLS